MSDGWTIENLTSNHVENFQNNIVVGVNRHRGYFLETKYNGYLGYPVPRPTALISSSRPPVPGSHKFPTSSISSYLKSSHYDHVDITSMVYRLCKPCWLIHASCTRFKETALLLNVHLSCFANFILCATDKYTFKVINKKLD